MKNLIRNLHIMQLVKQLKNYKGKKYTMTTSAKFRSKKEIRRLETRKTIQDAFIKLLEKEPYDKVQITTIIEKSGVARGTYYSHFPRKSAIITSVMEDILSEMISNNTNTQTVDTEFRIILSSKIKNQKDRIRAKEYKDTHKRSKILEMLGYDIQKLEVDVEDYSFPIQETRYAIESILNHVYDNRERLQPIFEQQLHHFFLPAFEEFTFNSFKEALQRYNTEALDMNRLLYIINSMAGIIMALITQWVKSDYGQKLEDIIDTFAVIQSRGIVKALITFLREINENQD